MTTKLNIKIFEAPDIPGVWVAHCVNYDVISQGNSPVHAFEMVIEALQMILDEIN